MSHINQSSIPVAFMRLFPDGILDCGTLPHRLSRGASSLHGLLRGLWRSRRGVAALEFALVAPLFTMIFVAGADITLSMRNRLRADQAVMQTMEIISQYTNFYADDFSSTFYPIAQQLGNTDPTTSLPVICGIVISGIDVSTPNANRVLTWQNKMPGSCGTSKIGTTVGGLVTLQAGYIPPASVPLLVVEIFSTKPLTGFTSTVIGTTGQTYKVIMAMPRTRILPPYYAGKNRFS